MGDIKQALSEAEDVLKGHGIHNYLIVAEEEGDEELSLVANGLVEPHGATLFFSRALTKIAAWWNEVTNKGPVMQ